MVDQVFGLEWSRNRKESTTHTGEEDKSTGSSAYCTLEDKEGGPPYTEDDLKGVLTSPTL